MGSVTKAFSVAGVMTQSVHSVKFMAGPGGAGGQTPAPPVQTTRCGKTFDEANTHNNSSCNIDADCRGGYPWKCFSGLQPAGPDFPVSEPPATYTQHVCARHPEEAQGQVDLKTYVACVPGGDHCEKLTVEGVPEMGTKTGHHKWGCYKATLEKQSVRAGKHSVCGKTWEEAAAYAASGTYIVCESDDAKRFPDPTKRQNDQCKSTYGGQADWTCFANVQTLIPADSQPSGDCTSCRCGTNLEDAQEIGSPICLDEHSDTQCPGHNQRCWNINVPSSGGDQPSWAPHNPSGDSCGGKKDPSCDPIR